MLQNGCVLSAVLAASTIRGGAGVWVNTQRIETHHRPWLATSCNLQSTLTPLRKSQPALPLQSFLWWQPNPVWFVYVCMCACVFVCVLGGVSYGCAKICTCNVQWQTYEDLNPATNVNSCSYVRACWCRCKQAWVCMFMCVCRERYRARGIMAPLHLCVRYCRTMQSRAQQLGGSLGLGWHAVG